MMGGRIPVIRKWLCQESLLLMETFNQKKKDRCKTTRGLFSGLSNRFKPFHNCITLSLHYLKLCRKSNGSVQELMGRLQTKVPVHEYREPSRLLTHQFIGGLNNNDMTDKILREVTTLENMEEATSECVLSWVQRVEVQRAQRNMLNNIKEAKD